MFSGTMKSQFTLFRSTWILLIISTLLTIVAWSQTKPFTLNTQEFAQKNGEFYPDRYHYHQLATGADVRPPFKWRVLIPWVASSSPLGVEKTFQLIALGSLILAACFLALILKTLHEDPILPLTGLLLLMGNWMFVRTLSDFWLSDLPTIAIVLGIALCYLRNWWPAVIALALIGGGVREMVPILGIALCFYLKDFKETSVSPKGSWLLPATGFASYLAIRIATGGSYSPNFMGEIQHRLSQITPGTVVLEYLFRPLSVAILVLGFLMLLRRHLCQFRWLAMTPFIFAVAFQLAAGSDTARLIAPLSILFILGATLWMGRQMQTDQDRWILLSLGLIAALTSILQLGVLVTTVVHLLWVPFYAWKFGLLKPKNPMALPLDANA